MSGVALNIEASELDVVIRDIDAIAAGLPMPKIVDSVTALVESQTVRRISDEKRAPDGEKWASWSPAYAETRHSGHSLLQGSGDMLSSIFGERRGDDGIVGTNAVQAALLNFGGEFKAWGKHDVEMPSRQFIGISKDNASEIEEVMLDYLSGHLS